VIIIPSKLTYDKHLVLFQSTRKGGLSKGAYASCNMSISTDDNQISVEKNREILFASLDISQNNLAEAVQTHSANIEKIDKPGIYNNCDALITDEKGLYLSIQTADCLPILIWDNSNRAIGAIHSGWWGTEKFILKKTIDGLVANYNSDVSNLNLYIGTGMTQKYFEVGQEFQSIFDSKYVCMHDSKLFMDNVMANYDQAIASGILKSNIEVSPYCSFGDEDLFYSYRRDKGVTGRNIAVIGWWQ
jgi:polyphenol oxidase